MDDNKSKINNIINLSQTNNDLETVLNNFKWSIEHFLKVLIRQIINELINIEKNQESKIGTYNPSFLYTMISYFYNLEFKIIKKYINCIITKENIDLILEKIIIINKVKIVINNKDLYSDSNNKMVNLFITIMKVDNKGVMDIIINNGNTDNIFKDLFIIFF